MRRLIYKTSDRIKQVLNESDVNIFDKINVKSISGIRVFYVGQGDAIGILDDNNEVVLYVDYGGLIDHPDAGNKYEHTVERLQPNYGDKNVPVILTHWDKDHYFSAYYVDEIRDSQWVVPNQRIGVQALTFSAKLTNAYRWPEGRRPIQITFYAENGDQVRVEKIKNMPFRKSYEDRNLTGLSVSVIKHSDGVPQRFILLPGDAPFHRIPQFHEMQGDSANYKYIGGMAYHHGSKNHWVNLTSKILGVSGNVMMIHSYGPSNKYGHPFVNNYDNLKITSLKTPDAKHDGVIELKF